MGKKKSKEPKPEIPNSSPQPSSDNIFKSLFGSTHQEPNDPSSVSIFSDSNPFRSKPTKDSQKDPQILQPNTIIPKITTPRSPILPITH
ncbi:hypothetical protein HanIR_Chr02g0086601 [Helianthus annuus]|nr:hypothetical protein HanIR_Chr02g0086601 [Helianthus annuus]